MEKFEHLDLFSGIGGFALAADRVFGEVEHTFCEIDPFCQEVLKKHWPQATIYGDIRTLTNTEGGRQLQSGQQKNDKTEIREESGFGINLVHQGKGDGFDILTGGFPCQPFSQAGRRKGTADDRYLWPEMLRVIREFHPRWIIGENVGGLVTWSEGLVLEQVHTDLESEGYEVQSFIIPAVAVNAPHRRDRIWIVGHANTNRQGKERGNNEKECGLSEKERQPKHSTALSGRTGWNQNWIEVATRLCRVDDGLPRRLDRNPRLKALGNAIVPQVAEEIMKAIYATLTPNS